MDNSLELRIERIKRFGNLNLQLLQSVYIHDGRSIAELYMNGEAIIHIHGLISGNCFCAKLRKVISNVSGGHGEVSVFVGVGEVSNQLCPVASFVRLQLLDICDMFIAQTFEVATVPTPEDIFTILDRKLSFILNRAGIEACQLIDEIIQGGPQVIDDFSNEDTDNIGGWYRGDTGFVLEKRDFFTAFETESLWFAIYNNTITYSLAENTNPTIQIRQVYACPFNPLISAIERMHMLYYP